MLIFFHLFPYPIIFPTGSIEKFSRQQIKPASLIKSYEKLICGTKLDKLTVSVSGGCNWLHLLSEVKWIPSGWLIRSECHFLGKIAPKREWRRFPGESWSRDGFLRTMLSVWLHKITDVLRFFCGSNWRSFLCSCWCPKVLENLRSFGFLFLFQKFYLNNSRTDLKTLISADCIPDASCSFMPS